MKTIQEAIRTRLSTEDEPYEGDIDMKEVENEMINQINSAKEAADGRIKFIFDGFAHSTSSAFIEFLEKLGKPQFMISLKIDDITLNKRYNLANEAEEDAEIGEEAMEALKAK